MGVQRDCMRDQIRRVLVQRILDGYYKPGDRLVELQIARELKTSQGPVREALRDLEALRLVESETYRGTRVRALSEREMEDAGQVRGVLEQTAAQWGAAALKRNVAPLRAELEAMRSAAAIHDLDAYAEHNMTFHRLIVEASGNRVLLRVWDSLMLEVRTRIGLAQLDIDLTIRRRDARPDRRGLRSRRWRDRRAFASRACRDVLPRRARTRRSPGSSRGRPARSSRGGKRSRRGCGGRPPALVTPGNHGTLLASARCAG